MTPNLTTTRQLPSLWASLLPTEDLQVDRSFSSLTATPLEGWELSTKQDHLPSGHSQRQVALSESSGNIPEPPRGDMYKSP